MRPATLIQTFVAVVFGLGFIVFGIVGFVRTADSERKVETKLQSIRAGEIHPETLTVRRKYVNPGRGTGRAHIIFRSERQPNVNISATRDFFNSLNLGDTISGYYFPDGYFIPQNYVGRSAAGKWFFLALGTLLGGASLATARAADKYERRSNGRA